MRSPLVSSNDFTADTADDLRCFYKHISCRFFFSVLVPIFLLSWKVWWNGGIRETSAAIKRFIGDSCRVSSFRRFVSVSFPPVARHCCSRVARAINLHIFRRNALAIHGNSQKKDHVADE